MYPCAILSTLTTRPQQVDKKIVYAGALRIKHQHHHHHHRITKFVMTSGGSGSRRAYLKESPGNQDQMKIENKKKKSTTHSVQNTFEVGKGKKK